MEFVRDRYLNTNNQYFCASELSLHFPGWSNGRICGMLSVLVKKGLLVRTVMKTTCKLSNWMHYHYILSRKAEKQIPAKKLRPKKRKYTKRAVKQTPEVKGEKSIPRAAHASAASSASLPPSPVSPQIIPR